MLPERFANMEESMEMDKSTVDRIKNATNDTLLDMLASPNDYRPEAIALAEQVIASRGGKEKVQRSVADERTQSDRKAAPPVASQASGGSPAGSSISKAAVLSLALSAFGIFICVVVSRNISLLALGFFITAIVLGHVGLTRIRKSGRTLRGRGVAIAGLTIAYLVVLLAIASSVESVYRIKKAGNRIKIEATRQNISRLSIAIEMYMTDVKTHPISISNLMQNEGFPNWQGPYVKDVWLSDAWGRPLLYEVDGTQYRLYSVGPDGKQGTADDITKQ